jgi:hypothetical protein
MKSEKFSPTNRKPRWLWRRPIRKQAVLRPPMENCDRATFEPSNQKGGSFATSNEKLWQTEATLALQTIKQAYAWKLCRILPSNERVYCRKTNCFNWSLCRLHSWQPIDKTLEKTNSTLTWTLLIVKRIFAYWRIDVGLNHGLINYIDT